MVECGDHIIMEQEQEDTICNSTKEAMGVNPFPTIITIMAPALQVLLVSTSYIQLQVNGVTDTKRNCMEHL